MRQYARTEFGLYAAAARAADLAASLANAAELAQIAARGFPDPTQLQLTRETVALAARAQANSDALHRAAGLESLPQFWPLP